MATLRNKSVSTLFESFGQILDELRRRDIIRSSNSPISDLAEVLVCRALKLKREPQSTKGFDAKDHRGRRYEIKGHRVTLWNNSRQLSAIRDIDGKHFQYLAVVIFESDFSVSQARLLPAALVKSSSRYRKNVNAWILRANDKLLQHKDVTDITNKVRRAWDYTY
jgi:hypothetical protein